MAFWQNSWSQDVSREIKGDPQTSLSIVEGVLSGTWSSNLELKKWKNGPALHPKRADGENFLVYESRWGLTALAVWQPGAGNTGIPSHKLPVFVIPSFPLALARAPHLPWPLSPALAIPESRGLGLGGMQESVAYHPAQPCLERLSAGSHSLHAS